MYLDINAIWYEAGFLSVETMRRVLSGLPPCAAVVLEITEYVNRRPQDSEKVFTMAAQIKAEFPGRFLMAYDDAAYLATDLPAIYAVPLSRVEKFGDSFPRKAGKYSFPAHDDEEDKRSLQLGHSNTFADLANIGANFDWIKLSDTTSFIAVDWTESKGSIPAGPTFHNPLVDHDGDMSAQLKAGAWEFPGGEMAAPKWTYWYRVNQEADPATQLACEGVRHLLAKDLRTIIDHGKLVVIEVNASFEHLKNSKVLQMAYSYTADQLALLEVGLQNGATTKAQFELAVDEFYASAWQDEHWLNAEHLPAFYTMDDDFWSIDLSVVAEEPRFAAFLQDNFIVQAGIGGALGVGPKTLGEVVNADGVF